jgi:phospholipid/cholesterol/gamma-HCH transport system substrate-binding protein
MAPKQKEKNLRVGFLVTMAAVIAMVGVFFIGSEQKIFARKQEYSLRFDNVSGLAEGNPVRISGVTVGVVKDIYLPRDPKQKYVDITLMIDKKYADLIRTDSRARMKKLGLLAGDSYIEISPGSPRFEALKAGANIPAARQTNVDQLISSGEDLVDNFVQISYSLKNILGRVDRGEGLIGELTTAPDTKQRITDTFLTTLNKTNAILGHVESGRGVIGKLVYDDKYADQLTGSLAQAARSLEIVTANVQTGFEKGEGMLPALLSDPVGKQKVYELVDNLRITSNNLATFTSTMQSGQGLLPRLMTDKPYADQSLAEFSLLVRQLNDAVGKINQGNGTAGKLINDPSVYESINDILIGINESKMLRWLIRNRQQSGIEKRFDAATQKPAVAQPAPPPPPAPSTNKSEAAPPDVPVTTATIPPAAATAATATTSTQPPPM